MSSRSVILFDLDGTILDSVELILRSYRHTMQVHRGNAPVPDDAVWMKGLGTPLRVQFRVWTDDPVELDAMVATYRDYNNAHHDALARPYDGVSAAVRALHATGKRFALVTSKFQNGARRGLALAGVADLFPVIIGADDVVQPKPHPEPVLTALTRIGAAPEEAVFVGDSRHDLESGRAAGVQTAAVLWGPFDRAHLADLDPDYWLERPEDLASLA